MKGTGDVRIPLSIWYPAASDPAAGTLSIRDYFHFSDASGKGEGLGDLERAALAQGISPERIRTAVDKERGRAQPNAQPLPGRYPVIAFSPGKGGPSFHLPMLCEYLAASGFIVVGVPSRVWLGQEDDGSRALTVAGEDLLQALRLASELPNADPDRLGLAGYSFGGSVAALLAMSREDIDAVAAIDPGFRVAKNYEVLREAPGFVPERLSQPLLVLLSRANPAVPDMRFLESVETEPRVLSFPDLRHGDFSSLIAGVFLLSSDRETGRDLGRVAAGHDAAIHYVAAFLSAHLKGDSQALAFLSADPAHNGFPEGIVEAGPEP